MDVLKALASLATILGFTLAYLQLRKQSQAQVVNTFLAVLERMEQDRKERHWLRNKIAIWGKLDIARLSREELEKLDRVCRGYDIMALFDRHGLLEHRLVDEFYGVSVVELYDYALGPYIEHLRKNGERDPGHYWQVTALRARLEGVVARSAVARRSVWFHPPWGQRAWWQRRYAWPQATLMEDL